MKSLRFSFVATLPVLFGYLFMGAAWGLLMQQAGYSFVWAFFISIFMYAGSGQFLLTGLIAQSASALQAAVMQLSLNCRHFFYGISFLQRFRAMGKAFIYMVFSLTDETYSLLCSVKIPKDMNEKTVWLQIAVLNHVYWIVGCTLGALCGGIVPFSTQGIDFAMTALFVVILVEQVREPTRLMPVAIGGASAALCLLIFGANTFILPSLLLSVALIIAMRKRIEAVKEAVK